MNLTYAVFQAYCAAFSNSLPPSPVAFETKLQYLGLQLQAYLKVTSQPEAYNPELTIIQANLLMTQIHLHWHISCRTKDRKIEYIWFSREGYVTDIKISLNPL